MHVAKVAISIDGNVLKKLDFYVRKKIYKNRSQAVQLLIIRGLEHLEHNRLARECEKLDAKSEQAMADLGLKKDSEEWPEY